MSSERLRIAIAPDGSEIPFQHTGSWPVAGFLNDPRVGWRLARMGSSWGSVLQRTATAHRLDPNSTEFGTGSIVDATAPVIAEYFGSNNVRIESVFTPGTGWQRPACIDAGRAAIRKLAKEGVTAIHVRANGQKRPGADFQMDELRRSMRAPRVTAL